MKNIKLLMVGNSLSRDAAMHLRGLLLESGYDDAIVAYIAVGGCSIDSHYRKAINNEDDYGYMKNAMGKWIAENRTLEANVVVRLREWSEDSTVEMTAVVGRETFITLLPVKGDGICKGQMSFPVNQESEVKLSASVHSGGVTVRENLGSWSDISMLLPIRLRKPSKNRH